jgi:arylsulfatase A-like enzyme
MFVRGTVRRAIERGGSVSNHAHSAIRIAMLALLICGCSERAARSPHPHLMVIIVDTLRADVLGGYGFPYPTSPELDAITERGVRFARTVSQSSWTRPSLGSMLTSQYPRTVGIYKEQRHVLSDAFLTLAEVLREGGYRTLGATANPNLNASFGFDQGFDEYWSTKQVWAWTNPEPEQQARRRPKLPVARTIFDRILAHRDGEPKVQKSMPHYVQITLMDVHEANTRKKAIRPLYRGLFGAPELREDRPYLLAVRQISNDVARFIRDWIADPEFEDTIFAILSDHGEGLSSHPNVPGPEDRYHGCYLYESHMLVPWILYHPGDRLPAGRVIEQPVRLLEVMPTILDLAGIERPRNMIGRSLVPLLQGGRPPELPEHFVVETAFRNAEKIGIYSQRWKYIENRDGRHGLNPRALHPMGSMGDGLKTDLADEHPDLIDRFAAELEGWERAHPKADAVLRDDLSQVEIEQLRSLGYLE